MIPLPQPEQVDCMHGRTAYYLRKKNLPRFDVPNELKDTQPYPVDFEKIACAEPTREGGAIPHCKEQIVGLQHFKLGLVREANLGALQQRADKAV